jgi:hypothetical protein
MPNAVKYLKADKSVNPFASYGPEIHSLLKDDGGIIKKLERSQSE